MPEYVRMDAVQAYEFAEIDLVQEGLAYIDTIGAGFAGADT